MFAFTTRGSAPFTSVGFLPGDWFVFGAETRGLAPALRESFAPAQRVRLPMRPGNRSLNLSNAVAVVVFEAWRQNGLRRRRLIAPRREFRFEFYLIAREHRIVETRERSRARRCSVCGRVSRTVRREFRARHHRAGNGRPRN